MVDSVAEPGLTSWTPGLAVGVYTLIRELARGGMGEIWLARQTGAAGFTRLVVLKRIIASADDEPAFVEMFLDEARIAAHLHHPNIVQVFELGQAGPSWFIAMEYLAGQPLSRVDRRHRQANGGPLPTTLAVEWLTAAARGLGAAHQALAPDGQPLHIVHRDVSPQNLFVTWDGHVKVLDFGIARAAGRLARTRTGVTKGKLAYMSPEQAVAGEVTAASDVYSLGIVLSELLTGARFYGELEDVEVFAKLVRREPPPPLRLREPIDPALEALVQRALSPEPGRRFSDGADFADALETWLRSCPQRLSAREVMHRLFPVELAASATPLVSPVTPSGPFVAAPSGTETRTAELPAPGTVDHPAERPSDAPVTVQERRPGTAPRERRRTSVVLPGVFISLLMAGAGLTGVGERLDDRGTDALMRLRGPIPVASDLVHVDLDDATMQAFGRWPWSRALQARLVAAIGRARPRAAVFDLIWSDPSTPEDDEALRVALQTVERRVLPSMFDPRAGWLHPLPSLRTGSVGAHNVVEVDDDGRWRRVSAELDAGTSLPHLGVALSRLLGRPEPTPAADGRLRVNWPGLWGERFTHVSAGELLRGEGTAAAALADKTVVMAVTAWGYADRRSTPWERAVPSPYVHTSLVNAAWTGRQLREASGALQGVGLLGVMVALVLLAGWRGSRRAAVVTALTFVGWLALAAGAFSFDVVMWTVRPAVALLALAGLFVVHETRAH